LKKIEKMNRLRTQYDDIKKKLFSPTCPIHRIVAIDLEAYEHCPRKLLEVGICSFDFRIGEFSFDHAIVKENIKLENKKYVKSHKGKFCFGKSSSKSTRAALGDIFDQLSLPHTMLLGHSLSSDISFIKAAKAESKRRCMEAINLVEKVDLQMVMQAKYGIDFMPSLEGVCNFLNIGREHLHNAGNDAALTLIAFLKVMEIPFEFIKADSNVDRQPGKHKVLRNKKPVKKKKKQNKI
jgi:DNA polymerase III epsilon subunit-like protein